MVVPAAHAKANVEDGPLPELRCKVILLVWIRNESVVRGHHCNVKVKKVPDEGGFVGARIARRDCKIVSDGGQL